MEYVPWIVAAASGVIAFAAVILARHKHLVLAEVAELAGDVIKDHEHGQSFGEAFMNASKSPKAKRMVDAILAKARGLAPLVVVFALALGLSGCTAEQLAADEAMAHAALVRVGAAVDWANANPAIVQSVLDDAAKASSDPALQKAVAKAKAAVDAGDLAKAQAIIATGAQLTAPVGPPK